MTEKVFALDTKPGIQRDGTVFDMDFYTGGQWVRFQRGRPRKIGGFRLFTQYLAGPSRGIYIDPRNAYSNVYNGYANGLQVLPISNTGAGTGITDFTLSNFTPNDNNLWQFDAIYDAFGSGSANLIAHPGQNLTAIDSAVDTPVLYGDINGTTMSACGVFTATGSTNGTTTITLAAANALVGAGQTVTGTNIPPGTTVVSVTTTSVVISATATGTGSGITFTFDNNISVSGGAVVLHPYLFVYGDNGLLKNTGPNNVNDWVSATANETNVSSTKIVKGLPVRGGSNAPSGLFWSLDSLIRVSYAPTTVTTGTTSSSFYWRYDIITSQSSILSSQSVIEYDGIYYWCGVDRFLMYGGTVKEVPNNFNQNYFFDNLNYNQRQKVWAQKVPRFGEIWWYFPSGDSEECNDAVIYNTREQVWYDAGGAEGARRSAGYFAQIYRYPVAAEWQAVETGAINTLSITTAGTAYTDGSYINTALIGGAGQNATANITVAGGQVTVVSIQVRGTGYAIGDILTASLPNGSGFFLRVDTLMTYTNLWQHEIGVDKISGPNIEAVESFFVTNDLGLVAGGPSQPQMVGDNQWLRLERVEPDFIQSGEMSLVVIGRPYAQAEDVESAPYMFEPGTHKIDMKEQRRELRLRFGSNVLGGNYQLGRVLLNADTGDVRGY